MVMINNGMNMDQYVQYKHLSKKNGGLDDEAPKKAMTDAMTKAFSHLGMSADVFLGNV